MLIGPESRPTREIGPYGKGAGPEDSAQTIRQED